MRVLLDVTRVLAHRFNETPDGIDRVEYALVRWLLANHGPGSGDVYFVITAANMHAALTGQQMARIVADIEQRWSAGRRHDGGSPVDALVRHLCEPLEVAETLAGSKRFGTGRRKSGDETLRPHAHIGLALANGWPLFRRLRAEARLIRTVYVHSSHIQLEYGHMFEWLKDVNIKASFFLHDMIPIDFPEFCGPSSRGQHINRLKTIAAHADHLLVNSDYTRDRVMHHLPRCKQPFPGISVCGLGTEIRASDSPKLKPIVARVPYFLCLGTIEGRKNLTHIINVWRRILDEEGPERTPRLLFVGKRGWECQNVFNVLDRSTELAPYLVEASGMTDAEVATLVDGAAAVLAPSWVEGFSLPPMEAICRGAPVVASDIAVHRELISAHALLLDPVDGKAWKNAVLDLAWRPEARKQIKMQTAGFSQRSWDDFAAQCMAAVIEACQK